MVVQDGWYQFDNDINSLIMALSSCYVVSGMVVAEDSPLDMGVVVAAGTYYANGTRVVKGSETDLPLDASDPGLARKDLIVGDSGGTISFVKGTDAAAQPSISSGPATYSPVPPNIPSGKTLLGEVWVGAGVNSIVDADVTDRRVIVAHLGVDAEKLEASTKAEVRDHTPKAHTLDSHSSKPHSELADAPADAHHPQSHDLASHSTKAHTELTGVTPDLHHPQAHDLASHSTKAHTELTGVSSDQHHVAVPKFYPLPTPWVSQFWDGDDKGDTASTLIDVSNEFGEVTTGIVAYAVRISAGGSAAGYFCVSGHVDPVTYMAIAARPEGAGDYEDGSGIVPATPAGDFYFASLNCSSHWIQIHGYWKIP